MNRGGLVGAAGALGVPPQLGIGAGGTNELREAMHGKLESIDRIEQARICTQVLNIPYDYKGKDTVEHTASRLLLKNLNLLLGKDDG